MAPDTMGEAGGIEPDIGILLAQTWQTQIDDSMDSNAICRIWAFDFGWFDMETALRIRDNLIQTGWLVVSEEMVQSSVDISGIEIPFGWLPSMRILESPPLVPKGEVGDKGTNVESEEDVIGQTVEPPSIDPAVTHTTALLDQIAEAAGLDRKEIMRRAQRKRRALGPVTLWMALLLVAREQQLPMGVFVNTIST